MDIRFYIIADVNPIEIALIVILAFAGLTYFLVMQAYGKLWLQARLSGAPVTFAELIGMTLRKVDIKTIVVTYITAKKAGLDLSTIQLESHFLAGGNVPNVIKAMIVLDSAGINPGWDTLRKEDLQGIDVLEEAYIATDSVRDNNSGLNEEDLDADVSEMNTNEM